MNTNYQGRLFEVSNTTELHQAINQVNVTGGNAQIVLSPGVYNIENTLNITSEGVVIRSETGRASEVIIQGDKMSPDADIGNIMWVGASNFTLDGVTLQKCGNHTIQIAGEMNPDNPTIKNSILKDSYEQLLKVSSANDGTTVDNGIVENTEFSYSAGIGPNYYIGGMDVHGGKDWVVSDNVFKNIASPADSVAEHAVHFWNGSSENTVENNVIIDSDRGIGFGMRVTDKMPTEGGVIQGNIIFHSGNPDHAFADVGIALEENSNTEVTENIIILNSGYPNAIETRWPESTGNEIYQNMTNVAIIERDGAKAEIHDNNTNASNTSFTLSASGDLLNSDGEIISNLKLDTDTGTDDQNPSNDDNNSFDGTLESAVILNHDAAYELENGSIEFVVTPDVITSGMQGLFSKDSSGFDDGGHIGIYMDGDDLYIRMQDTNGQVELRTDSVFTAGEETHLAVNFGEGGLYVYANGEEVIADTSWTHGLQGNEEPIVLGANQWGSGDGVADNLVHPFTGTIENVKISDTQLDTDTGTDDQNPSNDDNHTGNETDDNTDTTDPNIPKAEGDTYTGNDWLYAKVTEEDIQSLSELTLFEATDLTLLGWAQSGENTGPSINSYGSAGFDAVEGAEAGTYAITGHIYDFSVSIVQFDLDNLTKSSSDDLASYTEVESFALLDGMIEGYEYLLPQIGDVLVEKHQDGSYDVIATDIVGYNAGYDDLDTFNLYQDLWGDNPVKDTSINDTTENPHLQMGGNMASLEYSPEVIGLTGFDHMGNTAPFSIVSNTGVLTGTTYMFNKGDVYDGGDVETKELSLYEYDHDYLGRKQNIEEIHNIDDDNSYWISSTPDPSGQAYSFSIGGSLVFVRSNSTVTKVAGYGMPGLDDNYDTGDSQYKGGQQLPQAWNTSTGELHKEGPVKKDEIFDDPDVSIVRESFIEVFAYSWADLLNPSENDPKPYSVTTHKLSDQSGSVTGVSLSQDENNEFILAIEMSDAYDTTYNSFPQYLFYQLDLDKDGSGNQLSNPDGIFDIDESREWEDVYAKIENLGDITVLGTNVDYLEYLNGSEIVAGDYSTTNSLYETGGGENTGTVTEEAGVFIFDENEIDTIIDFDAEKDNLDISSYLSLETTSTEDLQSAINDFVFITSGDDGDLTASIDTAQVNNTLPRGDSLPVDDIDVMQIIDSSQLLY
ncbi:MAG: LamG-like jellyroll fold domain-containing protein [Alphaproteobacteria bacterium]